MLTVVISYELVRRYGVSASSSRQVARALARATRHSAEEVTGQ